MPKKNRLTNNSDETDISSLLSGDNVFTIPYFQRAYTWKTQRLKQLHEDILRVVDDNDLHFLGAVIVHGRRSNPADPDVYDVIDGQQRITTIYLYLAALVKTLCELGEHQEAKGLFLKYLAVGRDTRLISSLKLHSCKEDRAQLNFVIKDLLSNKDLAKALQGFKPKYLPATGSDRGTLRNNYRAALRYLRDQADQAGIDRIREISTALLSFISVVQIDVSDPTNGPKIFDSLNSLQEPMTIGDLVRNEIFSRIADKDPATIDRIDEEHWQPFYKHFQQEGKNLFDKYFFPYGLIHNPNTRKSEVYSVLRDEWRNIDDPDKIIDSLSEYQNAFIDILSGTNYQKHPVQVSRRIRNYFEFESPGSVHPFLMNVSNAIRDGLMAEKDGIAVLDVIESFLIRRAVCGHEPTGLHAVFKRLWADCNGKPTRESVIQNVRRHRTVVWPNAGDFRKSIEIRPMYGVGITSYVLLEYDRSLKGDQPKSVPWIEHVLPETPAKEWFKEFSKQEHSGMKDLLANLIPLSEEMNRSISNKPYKAKRERYAKDSMFKSAREFANRTEWTPAALVNRSKMLANWAVMRWPD